MTSLHTRSRCDECDRPAVVEVEPNCFLCESCEAIVLASLFNSNPAVASSDETVVAESSPGSGAATVVSNPSGASVDRKIEPLETSASVSDGPLLQDDRTKGRWSPSRDDMETSGPALFAADEISKEMETDSSVPWSPPCRGINGDLGPALSPATFGAINPLDFETEVSALEAEWLRTGVSFQNSNSLRVRAESEMTSSSVA